MEPKGGDNVKKFLAGILFGGILVFSITGYADSLIGKQIDATFPLFINNEQSPKNVVSIEGTSYLPVRSAGEMFGYDVNFQNETVFLSTQKQETTLTLDEGEKMEDIREAYVYESNIISIWRKMDQETSIMKEKERLPYLRKDGEIYVPWQIFNNFRTELNVQEYPNGNKIIFINPKQEYERGIDYFSFPGTPMIKLSITGYKAEIKDGAVWIEAQ